MASPEDLLDGSPPAIDPYEILDIDRSASIDKVRAAYRKAALKNHPDKAVEAEKHEATVRFQTIACAYAILSDPTRRQHYDETGSISESIVDSDGFSWSDFYREQFRNAVSEESIERFSKEYRGSEEEKADLLASYEHLKGDMDKVYERVMLSDARKDDERFRAIIEEAISDGTISRYAAYAKETKRSRKARAKAVGKEAEEAEEYAKELGLDDKLRGKEEKAESSLAAMILKNKAKNHGAMEQIIKKYSAPQPGKKRKGQAVEEPDISEGEFERVRVTVTEKAKKRRAG